MALFPSGDDDALAGALAGVLDGAAIRERLRRAARLHAHRFSWDESARQHLAVGREVAGL